VASILRWIAGVFVLGKADVSHFALLLCPVQGFGGAVRTNEKLGVIIE
jgi:hypothetical protein